MRSITVERISDSVAQEQWAMCGEAIIFTHPNFLTGMCSEVHWWMGTFRKNPIFFWPVCLDDSGRAITPALAKYVGPFATDDFRQKPFYRQWSIQEALYPAFLCELLSEYGNISFATRPGQTDTRQFEWWSETERDRPRLKIQNRYTAIIPDIDFCSAAELRGRLRRDRKAQLSKASALDLRPTDKASADEIFELYRHCLQAKGAGKVADSRAEQVNHLASFARNEQGKIIAFRDNASALAGVLILLFSRNTAHSTLAVASEEYRQLGLMAMLEYHAIKSAREAGKRSFDFLGANSPKGAAEKHSYGAVPELYFAIESL